jgi:multiple sugar transport system permease protein
MTTRTLTRAQANQRFAYLLLAPSLVLLVLLIGYPMLYNVYISFFDVPLNPKMASTFIGLENYIDLFTDKTFYRSVAVTLGYTFLVTFFSTAIGLFVAVFLNRDFYGKRIVNAIIILSYVVPSICLIFVWKYMFNNIYGIINFIFIDLLHLGTQAPLWFDTPVSAFLLAALFSIWRFFPYAYISFTAILQSIDQALYEAADIDGANAWNKFSAITYPAIKQTMAVVVSLRIIWVFYIFTEVYLLTSQVDVIGVYLYKMAFASHDFGKAAAISIVLFAFIFTLILFIRKRVFRREND